MSTEVQATDGDRLSKLEERVDDYAKRLAALERDMETHRPVINEHDDRLDAHDERLARLETSITQLVSTTDRLLSAATAQGLVMERVDRTLTKVLELATAGRL